MREAPRGLPTVTRRVGRKQEAALPFTLFRSYGSVFKEWLLSVVEKRGEGNAYSCSTFLELNCGVHALPTLLLGVGATRNRPLTHAFELMTPTLCNSYPPTHLYRHQS